MSAPYDVFISHCGQDSKRDFAIMLRNELQVHARIRCFFDERDLHPGDNAPKEMLNAMATARIGIVILSSGFLKREWCMKELQTFVDRRNLLPIFFGVGPDQLGTFAEGAAAACAKFTKLGITPEEYKRVVKAVGSFTGVRLEALDGFWDKCFEKVRLAVQQRLGVLDGGLSLSSNTLLVGIDLHLAKLKRLLGVAPSVIEGEASMAAQGSPSVGQQKGTLVGIWAMGGVGKTTLAASLFDDPQVRQAFGNKRVWVEVNKNPSREQICKLQEQIIDTLCNLGSDMKAHIHNPREGAAEIRWRLADAKVLVFLDNVWNDEGRSDVLSPDWLGPGSCIVITTRSKETIGEGRVYGLDRLDPGSALKLFSWHAFGDRGAPCASLQSLASRAADLCGGIPLAIQVIGALAARETSSLAGEAAIRWWEDSLLPDLEAKSCRKLNELSGGEKVIDVLRLSYEGLPKELQRSFVLIAGMWHGVIKNFDTQALVIKLAAAVYGHNKSAIRSAEHALEQLTYNSLLKQVAGERHRTKTSTVVVVHDLLVDLGMLLADQEPEFGRWVDEERAPKLRKEGALCDHLVLDARSVKLDVPPSFFNGGETTELGLKSAVLRGCRLPELSPGLADCRLLSLINLESVEKGKAGQVAQLSGLTNLLCLDLMRCKSLVGLEGLGGLTALQSLDLSQNPTLTALEGVGVLTRLRRLDVSWCKALQSLGDLSKLGCLETLEVRGCSSLTALQGLGKLARLRRLDLSYCQSLTMLDGLGSMVSLRSLKVSKCGSLRGIEGLGGLHGLQSLLVRNCSSMEVLERLEGLEQLLTLEVRGCNRLAEIRGLGGLKKLTNVAISGCISLKALECFEKLVGLQVLEVSECETLTGLEGLGGLTCLQTLTVTHCKALTALDGLSGLADLRELTLKACGAVKVLENLSALTSLQTLWVEGCGSLTALEGLGGLVDVNKLDVIECGALTALNGLGGLVRLKALTINSCRSLTALESLAALTELRSLYITRCKSLTELTGLRGLTALWTLSVTHCRSLRRLEGLEGLTTLRLVEINGCGLVTGLEGLAEMVTRKSGSMHVIGCDALKVLELQNQQASDSATAGGATLGDAAAPESPSVGQPGTDRCNTLGVERLATPNGDKKSQVADGPDEAVSPGTRENLECLLDSFQSS